jgi:hypothetical protein
MLSPGSRLGAYEITAHVGAGGMGEVYRAKDLKLHRDVALKILPSSIGLDPERILRFRREAQVLASPSCEQREWPRTPSFRQTEHGSPFS